MTSISNEEWASLRFDFPNLVRNTTLKRDEASPKYNCIAWSIGEQTRWINPAKNVDRFKNFYRLCGFQECTKDQAIIDGYMLSRIPTHGARFNTTFRLWESKCGEDIRITHDRDGLAGGLSIYGNNVLFFRPAVTSPSMAGNDTLPPYPLADMDNGPQFLASQELVTSVAAQMTGSFSSLATTFDQAWKDWVESWKKPACYNRNSSEDFATGPGWDALVKMGTSILPKVVEKLKDAQFVFACDLYNKLQTDPKKKVNPDDLPKYLDLNNQAKEIIRLYSGQITDFNVYTRAWEIEQKRSKHSAHSNSYTSGWAYEKIREMDTAALPLIMARYSAEQDGWWHELLYEIKHGKKSEKQSFDKPALYKEWAHNFQVAPRTLTAPDST